MARISGSGNLDGEMLRLADNLAGYVVDRYVKPMLKTSVSYFTATVVSGPNGQTMRVQRAFDSTILTLPYADNAAHLRVGANCTVFVFGSINNAIIVGRGNGSGGGAPTFYAVTLNGDGTVNTADASLDYDTIKANLANPNAEDILNVLWGSTRFQALCAEITNTGNGDLKFIADVEYAGIPRRMVFTLDPNNVLTTTSITTGEIVSNKTQDIVANSASQTLYPSAYAVYSQFQRKPDVIYQTDGTTGLTGANVDLTASPAWQLTGLNLAPYKRIKAYIRASGPSENNCAPQTTVEVFLDARGTSNYTHGHFCGSAAAQYPNNANRLVLATFAVSSDKTSIIFLRHATLYGTAATSAAGDGRYCYLIEGYYD